MSGHTPLPIRIAFGGAQGSLQTTTRALDTARLVIVADAETPVPGMGTEVGFEVLVAGSTCRGSGRVAGEHFIQAYDRTERVIEIAITVLDPAAADRIQRVVFRERMQAHGEAGQAPRGQQRILGAPAPGTEQRRILQLDEQAPPPPEEPKVEPLLKSEKRDLDPGRTRPRPSRHHWEVPDRWRVR